MGEYDVSAGPGRHMDASPASDAITERTLDGLEQILVEVPTEKSDGTPGSRWEIAYRLTKSLTGAELSQRLSSVDIPSNRIVVYTRTEEEGGREHIVRFDGLAANYDGTAQTLFAHGTKDESRINLIGFALGQPVIRTTLISRGGIRMNEYGGIDQGYLQPVQYQVVPGALKEVVVRTRSVVDINSPKIAHLQNPGKMSRIAMQAVKR